MARGPLRVLLSIRRRSIEQARYALAACLTTEAEIADRITSFDDRRQRDRETSRSWPDSHHFMEITAIELETVHAERRIAAADLEVAQTRTADARSQVAAARLAAEAVEQLIAERGAAAQADANRRDQHALDDIAGASLAIWQRRGHL
jgi:flagellar biosynthesis chaperone FliJ